MAIPKVCGIENEFAFSVFDLQWSPVASPGYEGILFRFVKEALLRQTAVKFDQSGESRHSSFLPVAEDASVHTEESAHNAFLTDKILRDLDGFLDNGARFYLDGHHPEYSTPECLLPLDAVLYDKASELFMLQAINAFRKQPRNSAFKAVVHKNNSDGLGHSYGCHLNVLLDRELVSGRDQSDCFMRSYIPFQIVRMVLCGAGKVGSENGRPPCQFQIWQRADFFTTLHSGRTMEDRPIFNTRDEPHANWNKYFRLHDIATDALRCESAIFLKVALTQVVLAMIEDKVIKDDFFPADPIAAIGLISRDLSFKHQITFENGKKMTGLELLRWYLGKAEEYLGTHPMHEQHMAAVKWGLALLDKLEKDWQSTVGELDWTTARRIVESKPNLAKKNLSQLQEINSGGLFDQLARAGKIKRLLSDDQITQALTNPPVNTRAFLRSMLLKKFKKDIRSIGWQSIRIENKNLTVSLDLDSPLLDEAQQGMVRSILER